jgi:hypothetical protein
MKHLLFSLAAVTAITVPALAADVGVSLTIGQPGFYGQLELGDVGRPELMYERPVTIRRGPHGARLEPVYVRVPRSHAKNWRTYCARYGACDHPTYFVKDNWYNNVYAPHYRDSHRQDDRDHNRNEHRDEHRDNGRDEQGNRGDRHE